MHAGWHKRHETQRRSRTKATLAAMAASSTQPCDGGCANNQTIASLLLAARGTLLLALARNNFPKHDDTIPVHEGNARQAFAILEGVAHERLLRLERALRHLVGLQGVGVLHLLSAG